MDPLTGIIGLTALSAASLLGMKLKREGFETLPGGSGDGYPSSVEESQTRYNKFSGMINPLLNGVIPVGSDAATVDMQRELVNQALGNTDAVFSTDKVQTLDLKEIKNKYIPRAEGDKSLFGAIRFCKEAAEKTENPFSIRDPTTNKLIKSSEKSANGVWDFDEVCGVCLTSGLDEEGRSFEKPRGLLVDPNAKRGAYEERSKRGFPYARLAPSLATCEGAPNMPVFAGNNTDLQRYRRRLQCQHGATVGGDGHCAICFEYNTRSYVPIKDDPEKGIYAVEQSPINLKLQGVGVARITLTGKTVADITLEKDKAKTVALNGAIEGQVFGIAVSKNSDDLPVRLYGYIESTTPNGGIFRMPLNLIMTKDVAAGNQPPKRSFGFYKYKDFNFSVAVMGPATGKSSVSLEGLVPFTFVDANEFSAMDCPAAPFQATTQTIRDYSADQPCFSKDAKPGSYSEACLKELVLNVGCTSQGTLYNNPSELNGTDNDLETIYQILQDIKDNDMVDEEKTMKCSGRKLARPCDPFLARTDLKFRDLIMNTENTAAAIKMKDMATQCLAAIYNNDGANYKDNNLGPTYSGLVTYKNNQRERKNIYCLPDGKLNPQNSDDAMMTLAKVADEGYKNMYSVEAVKKYLNDQLELAADWRYDANSSPARRSAIQNCFGRELSEIPKLASQEPSLVEDECGIVARYIRVLPSLEVAADQRFIEISQLVVVDKTGTNVSLKKSTTGTSPPFFDYLTADNAVDGRMINKLNNFYHSTNDPNAQFIVDLGDNYDVTRIIYYYRNSPTVQFRKNGIRLQLLNDKMQVLDERKLNSTDATEQIVYQQDGSSPICKSTLPPPKPLVIPEGFISGFFFRWMSKKSGVIPGFPSNALLSGSVEDDGSGWLSKNISPFIGSFFGARGGVGMFTRFYFAAKDMQELIIKVQSDYTYAVKVNGIMVLDNRKKLDPTTNINSSLEASSAIYLPEPGLYPVEIIWYNANPGSDSGRINIFINGDQEIGKYTYYDSIGEKMIEDKRAAEIKRKEEERLALLNLKPVSIPGYAPGLILRVHFLNTFWIGSYASESVMKAERANERTVNFRRIGTSRPVDVIDTVTNGLTNTFDSVFSMTHGLIFIWNGFYYSYNPHVLYIKVEFYTGGSDFAIFLDKNFVGGERSLGTQIKSGLLFTINIQKEGLQEFQFIQTAARYRSTDRSPYCRLFWQKRKAGEAPDDELWLSDLKGGFCYNEQKETAIDTAWNKNSVGAVILTGSSGRTYTFLPGPYYSFTNNDGIPETTFRNVSIMPGFRVSLYRNDWWNVLAREIANTGNDPINFNPWSEIRSMNVTRI